MHIPSLLPLPRREPLLLFLRPLLSSLVPRFFLLELGLLTPFFFHSAQRSCSLEPCALSRLHRQKEKRRRWRRRRRWEGAPLRRREFLRYRSVASATRQMRISLAVDFLETIHTHTHTHSLSTSTIFGIKVVSNKQTIVFLFDQRETSQNIRYFFLF